MSEEILVPAKLTPAQADMAGMPAEWFERAARAVGRIAPPPSIASEGLVKALEAVSQHRDLCLVAPSRGSDYGKGYQAGSNVAYDQMADLADAALEASAQAKPAGEAEPWCADFPVGSFARVEHDGWQGQVCGYYRRDDGYEGRAVQLHGARSVHVYGLKYLRPWAPLPASSPPAGQLEAGTRRKVYLASRYSRFPEMQRYRSELEAAGFTVTSRWINGGHELTKEGSTEAHEAERVRYAQEDREDLLAADIVVSFTEIPRDTKTRGGRHVEHGMALALGKRTVVVGYRENVFHCLPEVEFFLDWPAAIRALQSSVSQGEGNG